MPKVHITLNDGEVVESYDLSEFNPYNRIAKASILSMIWDSILIALEKEENVSDKNAS